MSMRILHTDRMLYKQLATLRSQFEDTLMNGDSLDTARQLYIRLKELERKLPPRASHPASETSPAKTS